MPWTKVYSDIKDFERVKGPAAGLRAISYRDALLEATATMLEADKRVFVIGEGVDDAAGAFGTTAGLRERFGRERVMDTPLAENGMTGVAIGAAMAGMRPLLVHMRLDFTLLSMDQIINHAAKWHYMFGGRVSVPLTIRAIIGRGWGGAAQHTQSLQALFAHIPGLKVVMPATPYDAKGLLISAIEDDNPVISIEHRLLYGQTGHVPEGIYRVPIGKGIVRRSGGDATIVAISHMVGEAVAASEQLKEEGIECEVIDLRSLRPMDTTLIIESVKKTGRLVVADTGWKECGVGAEVIAKAAEEAFGSLLAPPHRIGLPDCPTPASPSLEAAYYPGKEEIVEAVRRFF